MKIHLAIGALLAMSLATTAVAADIVLAVHGGAGAIPKAQMTPEREAAIRADIERALRAGKAEIDAGHPAVDAVSATVVAMEDSPYFNAGHGAVFNHDGVNELDASIMEGHSLRAGAVAGLHRIRNPVLLARAVMEKSKHVMLIGDGAEQFARSIGMAFVDPSYFRTEERWQQLQNALQDEASAMRDNFDSPWSHLSTVGAVARDRQGHLAAATSTGGMTNKRWGRVGDAPIIGAGNYANAHCAVSATGWGEFYIRASVAHDICARVAYGKAKLKDAADEVVLKIVPGLGGDGGVIALDDRGNLAMPFNTEGMYRGSISADGKVAIAIYK